MTDRLLPSDIDFDGPFPRLSRRLRLGVVGGGRIAATQAMAARLSDCWDVVAGALSSDPEKSRQRAAEFYLDPARAYPSFAEMAEAEAARPDGVDGVMVTTPSHMHHAAAKAFLDAGIGVLCDKPLTNQLSEAEDLVGTAHGVAQEVGERLQAPNVSGWQILDCVSRRNQRYLRSTSCPGLELRQFLLLLLQMLFLSPFHPLQTGQDLLV